MYSRIPKAKAKGASKSTLLPATKWIDIEKIEGTHIMFSFNFLDVEHEAFNCGGTEQGWFIHLFENLREICKLTRNEFVVQQRNHYEQLLYEQDQLQKQIHELHELLDALTTP